MLRYYSPSKDNTRGNLLCWFSVVAMIVLALVVVLQAYAHVTAGNEEITLLHRSTRKAIRDERYRWTNGVIPYEFLSGHYNYEEQEEAKAAMKIWSDNTCLTFRPATGSDKNVLVFKDGNSCYSMIGMIGGRQYLTLGKSIGCRKMGLYLHELGHSIGLFHEHQQPTRDQHIQVNLGHVSSGTRSEFKKLRPEEVNDYGVPYDITSIMQYGKNAMSARSNWKTIEARDRSKNYKIVSVSEKSMIAFSDMKVVNLMYNCSKDCPDNIPCPNPGFINKNCECVEPTYIEFCVNKDAKCEKWKKNNQCTDAKAFMELTCPISCGLCTPRDGLTEEVFPTVKIDCRDKSTSCQMWADSDQCSRNEGYMQDNCPVACGMCVPEGGAVTTPKPTVTQECKNPYGDSACLKWAKKGECSVNPSFMLKQCAKACGKCGGEEATSGGGSTSGAEKTGQTTGGAEPCVNKYGDSRCKGWAASGQCKANPSFMLKECAKACKQCQGDEEEKEKETGTNTGGRTEAPCVNKYGDSKCDGWSRSGQCRKNPSFMLKQCSKACGVCGSLNLVNAEDEGTTDEEEEATDEGQVTGDEVTANEGENEETGGEGEETANEGENEETGGEGEETASEGENEETGDEGEETASEGENEKTGDEGEETTSEGENEETGDEGEETASEGENEETGDEGEETASEGEEESSGDEDEKTTDAGANEATSNEEEETSEGETEEENATGGVGATSCVDKVGDCKLWADAGYCETNTYTKKNCQKSCGLC